MPINSTFYIVDVPRSFCFVWYFNDFLAWILDCQSLFSCRLSSAGNHIHCKPKDRICFLSMVYLPDS